MKWIQMKFPEMVFRTEWLIYGSLKKSLESNKKCTQSMCYSYLHGNYSNKGIIPTINKQHFDFMHFLLGQNINYLLPSLLLWNAIKIKYLRRCNRMPRLWKTFPMQLDYLSWKVGCYCCCWMLKRRASINEPIISSHFSLYENGHWAKQQSSAFWLLQDTLFASSHFDNALNDLKCAIIYIYLLLL